MKHKMILNSGLFKRINNGTETIELRLNIKSQLLKIGDLIEFTNRTILETIIVETKSFFEELYKRFDKISMGYDEDDVVNPKDKEQYYLKEE